MKTMIYSQQIVNLFIEFVWFVVKSKEVIYSVLFICLPEKQGPRVQRARWTRLSEVWTQSTKERGPS